MTEQQINRLIKTSKKKKIKNDKLLYQENKGKNIINDESFKGFNYKHNDR